MFFPLLVACLRSMKDRLNRHLKKFTHQQHFDFVAIFGSCPRNSEERLFTVLSYKFHPYVVTTPGQNIFGVWTVAHVALPISRFERVRIQ